MLFTIICVIAALVASSCNKQEGPKTKTTVVTISSQYNAENNNHTLTVSFKPAIRQEAVVHLDIQCQDKVKTTLQNKIDVPAWSNNITLNVPVDWTDVPEKEESTIKIKVSEITGQNINCEIGEPSEVILNVKKD